MPFLPENGRSVLVSEEEHKEICALLTEHKIPYVDFSKFIGGTSSVLALFNIDDQQEWVDACTLCSALIRLKP